MNDLTLSTATLGVVPPVCDAEAGEGHRSFAIVAQTNSSSGTGGSLQASATGLRFSARKIRSVLTELCLALRSALDGERGTAEDSLLHAAKILQELGDTQATSKEEVRGGLSPWQVRKVTNYIEAHLHRPIRNEELATIVRLNQSYFGRAFRCSFGEPPHEYVIRRRVERAQGLMLSTQASLSDIALECGLSDQAHLCRLFRRIVGQSPAGWRRARLVSA